MSHRDEAKKLIGVAHTEVKLFYENFSTNSIEKTAGQIAVALVHSNIAQAEATLALVEAIEKRVL